MENLSLQDESQNTTETDSNVRGQELIVKDLVTDTGILRNSLEIQKRVALDDCPDQKNHNHNNQNENVRSKGVETEHKLYYQINDVPPWYLTIFLGFQHYLTMAGAIVAVPFILCPKLCMEDDDPDRANIISTLMFVSGMVTLLQTTFGTRLPIVQGGSFTFIIPALAILSLPQWECPAPEIIQSLNVTEKTELWELRMREIQGSIICASLFQILFGALGFVGVVLKYITPLTIAPSIAMIGLSLFGTAAGHAATNWGIALLTVLMITLFSQYMKSWKIPIPFTTDADRSGRLKRYPVFEVFPVLLTMLAAWALCFVLTETDVLKPGNPARTDLHTKIFAQSEWFRFPYPFQWGVPTVTAGAVFGMLSAIIAGIIESIGDYYACARILGAPPPPTHAINRGIFVEGIGCLLAGLWGTGNGTTSYSENIGAMSVTNVGSRRVIQTAGVVMIVCALIGKVGAVFISIPEPIIGGVFCVVFGIVTAVGLSNLQGVDFNSSRNIFIIGVSIFFSLTISQWMAQNPGAISLGWGVDSIDEILNILLSTGMFVAGLLGFILDNTIPGSKKERGIVEKLNEEDQSGDIQKVQETYDLPFGMNCVRRARILRYFPISPTFKT